MTRRLPDAGPLHRRRSRVYGLRMSTRKRTPRHPDSPARTTRDAQPPPETDLLDRIAGALEDDDPLSLLATASTLLAITDPRDHEQFADAAPGPDRDELVESFLAAPLPEISAVLAALACLSGDDVLRRRVHREIARRGHPLPDWLSGLARATAEPRAFEVTHTLRDGDNVLISVTLPGGHTLTAVVYIDHNMGTLVKDAFALSEPLDDIVEHLGTAAGADPDMTTRPLDPADARARIGEAAELTAMIYPPIETDTWPSSRALVEWMTGLLPAGGTGYEVPEWSDEDLDHLAERFRASRFAEGTDGTGGLLAVLMSFGTEQSLGDPMRWSPVAVEILLADWVPRTVVADVVFLAQLPDLLRAFIRFCHHERGVRAGLTEETLAAVDEYEAAYQQLIRSDRAQDPAGVLEAMGVISDVDLAEIMLEDLAHAVGGEAALNELEAEPLPDEPFGWETVPADVHGRVGEVLELVDRCCAELLDTEYRTACRRLLCDIATGDPAVFRRRGKATTAAAALCWLVGKANPLFDREAGTGPHLAVKHLTAHFGVSTGSVSQRSEALLRAVGADPHDVGGKDLGSARYLTGPQRARILTARDRLRERAGAPD